MKKKTLCLASKDKGKDVDYSFATFNPIWEIWWQLWPLLQKQNRSAFLHVLSVPVEKLNCPFINKFEWSIHTFHSEKRWTFQIKLSSITVFTLVCVSVEWFIWHNPNRILIEKLSALKSLTSEWSSRSIVTPDQSWISAQFVLFIIQHSAYS